MTFLGTNINHNQEMYTSLIKVDNCQIHPTSYNFQVNNILIEKKNEIKYIIISLINKFTEAKCILHYIKDTSNFIKNNLINIPLNIILLSNYYIDINTNLSILPNALSPKIYTNIIFSVNSATANASDASCYVNPFNHILSSKHELNEGFNSIDLNIDYLYCNFVYMYVKTNSETEVNLNGTLYANDHSSYVISNDLCCNENNIYVCDFYRDQRYNGNKFINSKLNITSNVVGSIYITYYCPNFISYDYIKGEMNFIDLIYYNLDNVVEEEDDDEEQEQSQENTTGTLIQSNRNLVISTFFIDLFNNTNTDDESNKSNKEFLLYKNLLLSYEKETALKLNENNITCSITFDNIDNGEYYYKCTQCNNSFSMSAFKQWIEEQSATCPTCRFEYKSYPQLIKNTCGDTCSSNHHA